ncbi:hypothetical protein DOTSEDRAFT_71340 [Dothistroma septosporum NZE10]|uniref:Uncharacterized protein n=1 Tax=Dothistroma septosporum (strain NZE10 / CBS 128990) TaxID=675120 RepID=N1PQA4_DOTSN|nr:hypothetical protein DOTSEDRAFT_71340 [Dothistroma septosporum NZE10]
MDARRRSLLADIGHANTVIKQHRDLAHKGQNVGSRVEDIWRNLTPTQREIVMRETKSDGVVLEHSRDPSMCNLFHFISEYSLEDMTCGLDHFLDMLKFRATADLLGQVATCDGPHTEYMM